MSRLFSAIMIGLGGYLIFKNRYRVINVVFGYPFIRRFLVGAIMSIPAVRNRLMKTVFSPPAQEGYSGT